MSLVKDIANFGTIRQGSTGEFVIRLQHALRRAGHELVVDGQFGGITRAAVERFQAANRIAADGLVGPITAAYLDTVKGEDKTEPLKSVVNVAPWLSLMRAITGTREIQGAKSNPLILAWRAELSGRYPTMRRNIDWYVDDATPWCGLGCAYAVGCCVPGYAPPIAPLRALNWRMAWEDGIPLARGVPGAIGVKERKGGGHVTLYESEWNNKVYCRGANQSDMINVAEYDYDVFTWHWPKAFPMPELKPFLKKFDAKEVTEV